MESKDLQERVNISANQKNNIGYDKFNQVSNENLKHVDMINMKNNKKNMNICEMFGSRLMVSHDEKSNSSLRKKMIYNSRESKKVHNNNDFSFVNKNVDSNTQNSDQKQSYELECTVISHEKIALESHLNGTNQHHYELSSNSFYGQRKNKNTKFSTEDYFRANNSNDLVKNSVFNRSSLGLNNTAKNYGRCDRATNDTLN